MKQKLTALLLLAVLLLAGCGKKEVDISAYSDQAIEIAGLTEEEFTITPGELAALECVSRSVAGATAKAGTVNARGPLLDTFLAQYGYASGDFYKIRILCSDGYKVVLKDEYLTDYEVVLTVSYEDEPLPENCQPLRLLIPEAESGKWAYAISRIEFEFPEEKS